MPLGQLPGSPASARKRTFKYMLYTKCLQNERDGLIITVQKMFELIAILLLQ